MKRLQEKNSNIETLWPCNQRLLNNLIRTSTAKDLHAARMNPIVLKLGRRDLGHQVLLIDHLCPEMVGATILLEARSFSNHISRRKVGGMP